MKRLLLILMVLAGAAHAQIGWTIEQCRKHWGRENNSYLYETNTVYRFGSKIEKEVIFDEGGKVKDVTYSVLGGWGVLKVPALLAREEGVTWERDPDRDNWRAQYWIGKKDGVVLFHARYYNGKTGESLHVTPIESEL
jgi:hypothetical protein